MNAAQAAHDRTLPLELRIWVGGKPVAQAVRSLAEAMDVWTRSGTDRGFLARRGDDGPPWPARPPIAGLVVTRAAAEFCLAMSLPSRRWGKRPGGVSFSRHIVDVLLQHPQGIHHEELAERVALLAGRPVPGNTLRHTLWRYGLRDGLNPNVWTASPATQAKTTGRRDRVEDPSKRTRTPRYRTGPRAPFFDWSEANVESLRRLAADGLDAWQIAEALGGRATHLAVVGKAHRMGIAITPPSDRKAAKASGR